MFRNTPSPDAIAALTDARLLPTGSTAPSGRILPPSSSARSAPTCSSSGPGSPASGRPCWRSRRIPGATSCSSREGAPRTGPVGGTAGFVSASLTHGFANGMERWPDDMPTLLRLGRENLDAIEKAVARPRHRLRLRPDGRARRRRRAATRSTAYASTRSRRRPWARRVSFLSAEEVRARVDSPRTWVRRTTPTGSPWSTRRGWPGDFAVRAWRPACACSSARPSTRSPSGDGDVVATSRRGAHPCPAGGAGHQRLPAAAATAEALRRPRVRLRPGHRAAHRRAVVADRLVRPRGRQRHREPVPLLPHDRGRPNPVGRLRRDLPLGQRLRPAVRPQPRVVRATGGALPADLPAAARASASRTRGAARSTPARASAPSGGRRTRAASPTWPATRGWASGPRASAPRRCSTCWTGARPSGPSWRWCAPSRCPFPPEPVRSLGIRLTTSALQKADANGGPAQPVAAGRSTGSASASTPDQAAER